MNIVVVVYRRRRSWEERWICVCIRTIILISGCLSPPSFPTSAFHPVLSCEKGVSFSLLLRLLYITTLPLPSSIVMAALPTSFSISSCWRRRRGANISRLLFKHWKRMKRKGKKDCTQRLVERERTMRNDMKSGGVTHNREISSNPLSTTYTSSWFSSQVNREKFWNQT